MIRDPFDSNNDRLSMSDAMLGDPRAEMRYGSFSSITEDYWTRNDRYRPIGLIDYVFNRSIPLRRRVRNSVLWLITVVVLFVAVSVAMTKLFT